MFFYFLIINFLTAYYAFFSSIMASIRMRLRLLFYLLFNDR